MFVYYVIVNLTQLIMTMHNICKVDVQTPTTTKKYSYIILGNVINVFEH